MKILKFRVAIPKDSIVYQIMPDFCRDGCFYQDDQYLESFIRRANQFVHGTTGHSSYGEAELLQYTGLKDRKNQKIYEGDILANDEHLHWLVVFEEASFKVQFTEPIRTDTFVLTAEMAASREVIGNITDDLESLKPPQP